MESSSGSDCSTSYSYQQGQLVFIMKFRSKCRIRIRALLVNEDTYVGWQPSGFIQQVRSRTRVGRYHSFQDLPQGDGGRIKREIDQQLTDDDACRTIDRDTYMHGSPSFMNTRSSCALASRG